MKRIFYRVAHKDTKEGLWYNKEGRYTGARQTGKFSFCKNSYLPMPFDLDLVGYLSVTDSLTSLFEWFSKKEIELLELYGFRIAIYETECYKEYKNHWAIKETYSTLVKMIRVCELVEIPTPKNLLGVKGYKVAVDFDDYEKVSFLSWEVMKRSDTYIYFRARLRGLDPETGEKLYKKKVYLHRYIMGITDPSIVVDHINGNTLDNRKENLRVCSVAQNNCNRTNKRNATGYKGVRKDGSKERPYTARIQHKRKVYLLGSFASPEEAHEAYCAKAKELHGEFWQPKTTW